MTGEKIAEAILGVVSWALFWIFVFWFVGLLLRLLEAI